jgi:hypothetical protein
MISLNEGSDFDEGSTVTETESHNDRNHIKKTISEATV